MAGGYDGSIRINTRIDSAGMNKGISSIRASLAKLAVAVAVAFSVRALIDFGKQALNIASDLNEVQNVVETAFGSMSGMVDEWAKSSIKNFGMSELAAKRTASTYMAMNAGMGLTGESAAEMALRVAERTADVSSFYNTTQEEADTMLKSIWTGETESLKQIGVVMTQTNLDAYAMANGFGKATAQMSQAEQVQLRYAYVMGQTRLAAGDFLKTQDSWANQTRILTEQWKQFLGILGNGLITVLTPAIKMLNQFMGVLIGWAQSVSAVISGLFGKQASAAQKTANTVQSAAAGTAALGDASASAADGQKQLAANAKKANKELEGQVASFDNISVLKEDTGSDSSRGSGSGGSAGAGGGSVSIPVMGEIGGEVEVSPQVQKAIDMIRGLFDSMNTALEPTKQALAGLWGEFERLGGFAWDGLKDFYNSFLKPLSNWVLGEGFPRFIGITQNMMAGIDWGKINQSLDGLWKSLEPFAENVGAGLLWLYENVLAPLGTWVMNEVVPRFLDILSVAIDGANGILEAAKPLLLWLWEKFLQPIASWTGGVIIEILDGLKMAMSGISDWVSKNGESVRGWAVAIGVAFATWKVMTLLSDIQQLVGKQGLSELGTALKIIAEDRFPKLHKSISGIGTKFKDMASRIGETVTNSGKLIKSLASSVYTTFQGALSKIANGLKDVAGKIGTAITESGKFIQKISSQAFTTFQGALSKISDRVKIMATELGGAIRAAKDFVINLAKQAASLVVSAAKWVADTAVMVAHTVATWASTAATTAAAAATWVFNAALAVLTSPITLIILAIGALIAIVVLCIKYWDNIKEAAAACWDWIVGVWNGACTWFKESVIDPIVNFFVGLWNGIVEKAQACWNWIVGIWNGVCTWFKETVIDPIVNFFIGLWNGIVQTAQACWNWIVSIWNGVCTWFKTTVIDPVVNFFVGMWTGIQNAAKACWDWIVGVWNGVCGWFKSTIIDPVVNFFTGMWDGLKNGASQAWDGITGVFGSVANWFKDIFSKAWEGVKNVFSTGGKIFDGIKDGIANVFKTVVNGIIGGINTIIAVPFNAINAMLRTLRNINILGVQPFGWIKEFGVPQIPKLANGAVIPPRQEFAAILGDQKSGRNLEAPEGLIRQIVREESGGRQNVNIRFTGSAADVVRMLKPELDKYDQQMGASLVIGGVR